MNKFLIVSCTNDKLSKNLNLAYFLNKNLNNSELWEAKKFNEFFFFNSEIIKDKIFPTEINDLYLKIQKYTKIIFTIPEHNHNFSAFAKNILDLLSLKERFIFKNKKIIVFSSSETKKEKREIEKILQITFKALGAEDIFFINWNYYIIQDELKQKNIIRNLCDGKI